MLHYCHHSMVGYGYYFPTLLRIAGKGMLQTGLLPLLPGATAAARQSIYDRAHLAATEHLNLPTQ